MMIIITFNMILVCNYDDDCITWFWFWQSGILELGAIMEYDVQQRSEIWHVLVYISRLYLTISVMGVMMMKTMMMMTMGMVMMMANRAVKARGQIPKRPIFQVRLTTRSPFYLSIHIGRQFIGTEIHILEIQAFLSFSSNPYSIYFRRRLTLNLSIFISIHLSNVGQMFILKFYFNSIKFWSSINSGSSYMDIISLREMFIDFFARFHMVCDRYTSYFDHFIFFSTQFTTFTSKKGENKVPILF